MHTRAALALSLATVGACVHSLESSDPTEPQRLSDEGLYADLATKTIAEDALAFAPAYPLWSDGAEKQRWMRLPPGGVIDTSDLDHWKLPVGTTLFKEFVVDGRRVETRVIERRGDADYRFRVYVWLPDESDAVASPDGARDVDGTAHDVPGTRLCMTCHRSEPGVTLGISAVQLSGDVPLSVADLAARGLLSDPPRAPLAIPGDATARAALGALHANCGHCHSAGGIAPMQRLRFLASQAAGPVEASDPFVTTVGVATTSWHDDTHPLRIAPGDPDRSAITFRMGQRGNPAQMPPIGTDVVNQPGLTAVTHWISGLGRN